MKINIVSNKVLSLNIRSLDSEHYDQLGVLTEHTEQAENPPKKPESSSDSQTHKHESEERQALFGARVIFFEDHFFVVFKTEILTADGVCINLEYESRFEVSAPLDDDFKNGNFPYSNAPAIAYPYLRAFISNLTLNSGYTPVMLPSLNFVAMKERIRAASR